MLTSDVSYEHVFEDGKIANRYQTEYIDANDTIYDQTPLQGINAIYYKINELTHEEVVTYFEELIEETRSEYDLDKRPALKNIIDNISLILETYGLKVDLLPQLNMLRKIFTDKTPANAVGKFYKRYRERIHTVNKSIKNSERLRKKILFNGKIVDLRTPIVDLDLDPTYEDLEGCEVIYEDWAVTRSLFYDWTGVEEDWIGSAVNGYFFIDYDKAYIKNSELSKVLDITKLEDSLGVQLPYEYFRITEVIASRESTYTIADHVSFANAKYHSIMGESVNYPKTRYEEVTDLTGYGTMGCTVVPNPTDPGSFDAMEQWDEIIACTIYAKDEDHRSKYLGRLIVANFIDVAAEAWTTRDNYRLVCFNLLDYINIASTAESYTITATIQDTSALLLKSLYEDIETSVSDLEEYYELCLQACSVNEDLEVFNTFFSNGMLAEYEENPEEAPWIKYPVYLEKLKDLLYNTHDGDASEIATAAIELINVVNPVNGNLTAIEGLLAAFQDIADSFTEETLDDGTTVADLIEEAEDGGVEKTYECDLAMPEAKYYVPWTMNCSGLEAGAVEDYDPDDHPETDESCFVAGTMVRMADGTDQKIEDVEIGDILLGENNSRNTVLEFDHPMLGSRQLYSINGGKPFVTAEHPFGTTAGWKSIWPEDTLDKHRPPTLGWDKQPGVEITINQLIAEDQLIKLEDQVEKVLQIDAHDAEEQRVYNFVLGGTHTYYADGYLVHNVCEDTSGGWVDIADEPRIDDDSDDDETDLDTGTTTPAEVQGEGSDDSKQEDPGTGPYDPGPG